MLLLARRNLILVDLDKIQSQQETVPNNYFKTGNSIKSGAKSSVNPVNKYRILISI